MIAGQAAGCRQQAAGSSDAAECSGIAAPACNRRSLPVLRTWTAAHAHAAPARLLLLLQRAQSRLPRLALRWWAPAWAPSSRSSWRPSARAQRSSSCPTCWWAALFCACCLQLGTVSWHCACLGISRASTARRRVAPVRSACVSTGVSGQPHPADPRHGGGSGGQVWLLPARYLPGGGAELLCLGRGSQRRAAEQRWSGGWTASQRAALLPLLAAAAVGWAVRWLSTELQVA